MSFNSLPIDALKMKMDEAVRFLSISLSIANAHTVDFYTRDVWSTFISASPDEVLSAINSSVREGAAEGKMPHLEADYSFCFLYSLHNIIILLLSLLLGKKNTTFGFCNTTKKLVDVSAILMAAKEHSLSGLEVCMQVEELMHDLKLMNGGIVAGNRSRSYVTLCIKPYFDSSSDYHIQNHV